MGGVYDEAVYGIKPAHVKHFWPFDEYRFGNTFTSEIFDVVDGVNIRKMPSGTLSSYSTVYPLNDKWHSSVDSGSRYLQADEKGNFECFNGTDWMILIASKGRGESCFECTVGRPTFDPSPEGMFLKIQPYYFAINFSGTWQTQPWGYIHTEQRNTDAVTRLVGTEYIIAFVKRANRIEHWINGVLQASNDLNLLRTVPERTYGHLAEAAYKYIPVMRPPKRLRFGHSGTGLMNQILRSGSPEYDYPFMVEGDTPAYIEQPASFGNDGKQVVNEPTQYAGLMFASWPLREMPDVATFMNWHANQWFAGNKRVDWDGT